jgi:RimJ/RimL family protein N-acetyltransferase
MSNIAAVPATSVPQQEVSAAAPGVGRLAIVPEPRPSSDIRIRPLQSSDADRLLEFGCHLSLETRYRRFFSPIRSLPRPLLTHLVTVDHDDREALAATVGDQLIGVARYDRSATEPDAAEVAVVIADDWHRHGLGQRLLVELSALAFARGIRVFTATTLIDNRPVAALLHQLWPDQHGHYSDGLYLYRLPLPVSPHPAQLALAG